MAPPDPIEQIVAESISPAELARVLGRPRQFVYDRIKSGRLQTRRVNKAHLISRSSARRALIAEAQVLRSEAARLEQVAESLA